MATDNNLHFRQDMRANQRLLLRFDMRKTMKALPVLKGSPLDAPSQDFRVVRPLPFPELGPGMLMQCPEPTHKRLVLLTTQGLPTEGHDQVFAHGTGHFSVLHIGQGMSDFNRPLVPTARMGMAHGGFQSKEKFKPCHA
jgi:hypothetical protein